MGSCCRGCRQPVLLQRRGMCLRSLCFLSRTDEEFTDLLVQREQGGDTRSHCRSAAGELEYEGASSWWEGAELGVMDGP